MRKKEERLERETRLKLATPALASVDHALPTAVGSVFGDVQEGYYEKKLERETRLELATPTLARS
ncbi:hypothetical protein, partial [Aeromonas piscicola]|uniref:hypothetical protein n=1 Tax=Aeromonas piscicola TaxID=600645 RepID=UPI0028E2492D